MVNKVPVDISKKTEMFQGVQPSLLFRKQDHVAADAFARQPNQCSLGPF